MKIKNKPRSLFLLHNFYSIGLLCMLRKVLAYKIIFIDHKASNALITLGVEKDSVAVLARCTRISKIEMDFLVKIQRRFGQNVINIVMG